ncbi:MAG: type I restriction endonuclease subunit R, partial [Bacteroidales bacterium]|nr:type I restriction endonuclease subunit R [Bacteroidales bacterium]
VDNILQNYDEYTYLKALQSIDLNDKSTVEDFKNTYFLTDKDIEQMQQIEVLSDRMVQDYKSIYNDIRVWRKRERDNEAIESSNIDWDDVVFEVDLLKSQEINLDYILELIFEKNKKLKDKSSLIEEIRKVIRASVGNRAKESLIVDFINETDLDSIKDKSGILESFYKYAQSKLKQEALELIENENLNYDNAKRYISISLKREFVSDNGTDFNDILPKMSPLNPMYLTKKQKVFKLIKDFVERFKNIGGEL